MMPGPGAGDDAGGASDADDNVICTICSDGQGGFTIYSGDEPEGDSGGGMDDGSEDDADAMGPAGDMPAGGGGGMGGGAPAPQGQPASSVGDAMKIVMSILQGAGGPPGGPSADDSFSAGFGGQAGAGASIAQKY